VIRAVISMRRAPLLKGFIQSHHREKLIGDKVLPDDRVVDDDDTRGQERTRSFLDEEKSSPAWHGARPVVRPSFTPSFTVGIITGA
jgi:hypothetical protein